MQLLPGVAYTPSPPRFWRSPTVKRAVIASAFIVAVTLFYLLTLSVDGFGPREPPAHSLDFVLIADKDRGSYRPEAKQWVSTMLRGRLVRGGDGRYAVTWTGAQELAGAMNEALRGMELSELVRHRGKLYTCDDRTGIVYEVAAGQLLPRHILADGDGNSPKGFKCEWMTMRGDVLYAGSVGKEWTSGDGTSVLGYGPMYIKTIDLRTGRLQHVDWRPQYTRLREATGTLPPGYLIHEAVAYSAALRKWVFAPRRVSTVPYDEKDEVTRGSNLLLVTDEAVRDVRVVKVGQVTPTRGFSSIKFIPGRPTELVALKSEEVEDRMQTCAY